MVNKDIYIQILLWAYEKQQQGFTQEELDQKFSLSGDIKTWVDRTFFTGMNGDAPLMIFLQQKDNVIYYSLTACGISAAVSYLGLKQSEQSSKYALWFAGLALLISAWQFIFPVNFNVGHCYVGVTVGDKITRMNCPNRIKIGNMLDWSWDSSYNVK